MLALSQSFRMGTGSIEHNLRITKGAGVRQNGMLERRHLNEDVVLLGNKFEKDYVQKLIHNVVEQKIGTQLAEINEKHLQQNHPGRVCSVDEWIEKQAYTRNDKKKSITREYILQLGNKFTNIPYVPATNENGEMLDAKGNVVTDTRQTPAYKDCEVIENPTAIKTKSVYREFIKRFEAANPQAQVISASIHSDERGGCHMHITVIWWSNTKNGVGYGMSETTAIRQQYLARGIKCKKTQNNNAQNKWRKDMRKLLEAVAHEHGIERLDMHNTKSYLPIPQYKEMQDRECELKEKEIKLQEKELELSTDIAKQEWYILKKNYPEVYKKIHNEYELFKKSVNKTIDKRTNVRYNIVNNK